jgi:retinol dehydrogenase 12
MTLLLTIAIGFLVAIAVLSYATPEEFREMARMTLFGSRNDASCDGGYAFDPASNIPSLANKVILITGAAGDLGRQAAVELARYGRPARIYVADLPRSSTTEREELLDRIAQEAYGDIESKHDVPTSPRTEIRFLYLDLTSLESIRKCAVEFAAQEDRLDLLILNAGIISTKMGGL